MDLRYAFFMAKNDDIDESPTDRKTCTLSVVTVRRLEKLAKKATHGTSVPKIMTHMIEQGIRDAIEKGYLKDDD